MTNTDVSAVPQPRLDSLVTDPATGQTMRRTEYSGTIWMGERPRIEGFVAYASGRRTAFEIAWFVPDSLPYPVARAGEAVVAVTVAVQSDGPDPSHVTDCRALLVPDPRGGGAAWLQLQLLGAGVTSLGLSYRIVVQIPKDAMAGA